MINHKLAGLKDTCNLKEHLNLPILLHSCELSTCKYTFFLLVATLSFKKVTHDITCERTITLVESFCKFRYKLFHGGMW